MNSKCTTDIWSINTANLLAGTFNNLLDDPVSIFDRMGCSGTSSAKIAYQVGWTLMDYHFFRRDWFWASCTVVLPVI
jgi:hypothetical protein